MSAQLDRALWGLEKSNHLIRTLSRGGAKLTVRYELHVELANRHARASGVAYFQDLGHAAQLHITAAHRHMGMAAWCMASIRQQLDPGSLAQEQALLEEACNTGLKAVDATKKGDTKKRLGDAEGR